MGKTVAVVELTLTRDAADKRHYILPGVAEAHVTGFWKPVVTLSDGRTSWSFGGKLGLRSKVQAVDVSGVPIAVADFNARTIEYRGRSFRIVGGEVEGAWKGTRTDVELFEGDRLVARFEPTQWGFIGGDGSQRMWVDEQFAAQEGLLVMFASNGAGHWRARDAARAGTQVAR